MVVVLATSSLEVVFSISEGLFFEVLDCECPRVVILLAIVLLSDLLSVLILRGDGD